MELPFAWLTTRAALIVSCIFELDEQLQRTSIDVNTDISNFIVWVSYYGILSGGGPAGTAGLIVTGCVIRAMERWLVCLYMMFAISLSDSGRRRPEKGS